jgi:hypothetical protein
VRSVSAGYPSRFGDAFRGERVPALSEVLAFLRDRCRVMIELKSDSVTDDEDGGLEAHTIEEIRRAHMEKESRAHLVQPPRAAALPQGGARDPARAPLPRRHARAGGGGRARGRHRPGDAEKGLLTDALFEATARPAARRHLGARRPRGARGRSRASSSRVRDQPPGVMMDAVRERA